MAVKIENNHIFLTVRDILSAPLRTTKTLSSFPLPQRGILGKKAQFKVQSHKQKSYGLFHREYAVQGEFVIDDYDFTLSGKIDGVYELQNRLEIEEIKSVILTPSEFKKLYIEKYPEFSEQVLFYSYLMQREKNGIEVVPFLTLINLVNDKIRHFDVEYNPLKIERLIYERLRFILNEILSEKKFNRERTEQYQNISWDLKENRPQQSEMMRKIEKTLNTNKHILVSAPTGTGKTAASLVPSIKFAIRNNKNIFFTTSKNTQQQIVYETLVPVIQSDIEYKIIFLKSMQSMCANDIFFCHEDFCPYAKNYQERLHKSNLLSMLDRNHVTPDEIFDKARDKLLCPAEVMMDIAMYADLIVGDYNYIFDPSVFLRRLFNKKDLSEWIVIIDEAHNLHQRGIEYYSPSLHRAELQIILNQYSKKKSEIYKNLLSVIKDLDNIFSALLEEGEAYYEGLQFFKISPDIYKLLNYFAEYEAAFIKYLIHKIKMKMLLQDDPFENLYYKLRRFIQVARIEGDELIPFFNAAQKGIIKIQCCDPAVQLSSRISQFHSVIGMSATLDPIDYYQNSLGFPRDQTNTLILNSPFPAGNRQLIIIPGISTRFKHRTENYARYAEIIKNVTRIQSGNYIAFFPGFEFLQSVNLFLGLYHGERIIQKQGMNGSDRERVLQEMKNSVKSKLLLAVMGGIFSEGVDFYGDMCIGVIIFSPGLPKVDYERELIRDYFDTRSENGFEYAYLYPGINKVIQAVGRLIRSAQDRGIIVLVGDRFADESVNRLLPDYWFQNSGDVIITSRYKNIIKKFWQKFN